MVRPKTVVFLAIMLLAGAYSYSNGPVKSDALGAPTGRVARTRGSGLRGFSVAPLTTAAPAFAQSADLPNTEVGITVEQAYAAIPHRRTVWVESDSPTPAKERAYLGVMFQVLDQAVAVRVAGQQNFASQRFDDLDIVGDYDRLIEFVRGMTVPSTLVSYNKSILAALSGQRQFFAEWKERRDRFQFAQQVGNHPGVRKASGALHAAYDQLMSKYRNETSTNKAAFYDYHCALDFL